MCTNLNRKQFKQVLIHEESSSTTEQRSPHLYTDPTQYPLTLIIA